MLKLFGAVAVVDPKSVPVLQSSVLALDIARGIQSNNCDVLEDSEHTVYALFILTLIFSCELPLPVSHMQQLESPFVAALLRELSHLKCRAELQGVRTDPFSFSRCMRQALREHGFGLCFYIVSFCDFSLSGLTAAAASSWEIPGTHPALDGALRTRAGATICFCLLHRKRNFIS